MLYSTLLTGLDLITRETRRFFDSSLDFPYNLILPPYSSSPAPLGVNGLQYSEKSLDFHIGDTQFMGKVHGVKSKAKATWDKDKKDRRAKRIQAGPRVHKNKYQQYSKAEQTRARLEREAGLEGERAITPKVRDFASGSSDNPLLDFQRINEQRVIRQMELW